MTGPDQSHESTSRAESIIQQNPELNDPRELIEYTRFNTEAGKTIGGTIQELGINPRIFPNAADLFAGNGPIAEILVRNGCESQDITCIDKCKPTRSLVKANWQYWNLEALAYALWRKEKLPGEVEKLRGTFDIVLAVQSRVDKEVLFKLGDYFLRPGGIFFADYNDLPKELVPSGKWLPFKGNHFFLSKSF